MKLIYIVALSVLPFYVTQRTDAASKKENDINVILLIKEGAMNSIASWIAYIVILIAGLGVLGIGWV
ncbi:hypothetical protein [Nitrosovibrio sp. Nv6]|uniref:hypothetical protein n=1 Tax=Nitrosovibrio sp. Nv6 TaxID=1855340 RepID=UPI0008BD20ED|nr:hypothetical protein [Nitrosovibrio sp. Nv6]SEO68583.1 hypothetical protein SAMN05216316_0796 [Nitrosovibrio sp. Nv6]